MPRPVSGPIRRDFIRWCARHRLRSLPAHPWTVAACLRWSDETDRRCDLRAVRDALHHAHRKAGKPSPDREPVVEKTVAFICNRREARIVGSDLFDADSLPFSGPPPSVDHHDRDDPGNGPESRTDDPRGMSGRSRRHRMLRSTPPPAGAESALRAATRLTIYQLIDSNLARTAMDRIDDERD